MEATPPEPGPWKRYFEGLGPYDTCMEFGRFLGGMLIFGVGGIFVVISALLSTLWEAADRGFKGGVFLSGREQTGFLLGTVAPWLNKVMHPINKRFVKHEQDSYMVNAVLLLGVINPILFLLCGLHTLRTEGVSLLLCLAYHQFRIGPFVMNFGYVYALAHREGHAIAAKTGMWKPPYDRAGPLRYVFNYWIGLFFGVTPASFDVGHSIIHHKYSGVQDELDTITCSDRPRDNWVSYVSYAPRFALYAANITTLTHFWAQAREVGNPHWKHFFNTVFGTAWYVGFVAVTAQAFGGWFALCYVGYPFMEQVVLLMMANWSWHAFIDPDDPNNEAVLSTTILNGQINVLNEDAHVTHHKYPGTHWSNTPRLLEKHRAEYDATIYGSVFKNSHVFEVGGLCLAGAYDELAARFVGRIPEGHENEVLGVSARERHLLPDVPTCPLPQKEVEELMKARLRFCWHGPRAAYQKAQKAKAAEAKKQQ